MEVPSPVQDILCINCQEMVNLARIAVHSIACTQVSTEVRTIESQDNALESVKFKIKKLNNYLKRQKNSHTKSPSDRNLITILHKLSDRVLHDDSLLTLKSVLDSLESLLATFQGSLSILIYIERFKIFAEEMKGELLSLELESKDIEIQALKAALQDEVNKAEIIEREKARQISEIESLPASSNSLSNTGSDAFTTEELVESEFPAEDEVLCEDARKAFYTQCLSIKLSLPSRSKGLKVSIPALYEKTVRESIPQENWTAFIKENLSNPGKDLIRRTKTNPKFAVTEHDTRFNYYNVPTISEVEPGTELD